uniref:Reverse transcriptase zinc-binding domain-containing protein n=1 Tax=Aegilops tauschii subsp. strangulata TaxID=200361 RepID=A0A453RTA7_AEGTS
DRCWTTDRLARRGLQHLVRCPLCDQDLETMHHLILACPFAPQIWYEVLHWLRLSCAPPDFSQRLVAHGAAAHSQTHAQGPRLRDPPRPMDD